MLFQNTRQNKLLLQHIIERIENDELVVDAQLISDNLLSKYIQFVFAKNPINLVISIESGKWVVVYGERIMYAIQKKIC